MPSLRVDKQLLCRVILLLYTITLISFVGEVRGVKNCRLFTSCSSCISSALSCAWCDDSEFYKKGVNSSTFRILCDKPQALLDEGCPPAKIVDPENSEPFSAGTTAQLSPNQYIVHMRTTREQNFTIKVTPRSNFPLDLYILMDISNTMSLYLNIAKNAADLLLDTVTNLTSDSKLGFGTFVDKRIRPYVNIISDMANAYENVQSLTNNLTQFQNSIQNVNIADNQDNPEGTLDAIMQAALCQDAINWRGKFDALRLILVMTDDDFHLALDDLIAGVTAPNRVQCGIIDNVYNEVKYQYPSYAQIAQTLLQENILLTFAVSAEFADLYTKFNSIIYSSNTSSSASILSTDPQALIDTIKSSYETYSKRVSPVLINKSPYITQSIVKQTCGVGTVDPSNPLVCNNVSYGTTATYSVYISLSEDVCSLPASKRLQTLEYSFVGFGRTLIEVHPICSCNCTSPEVANSSECSKNGSLICSVCECNPKHQGSICDCYQPDTITPVGCINPADPGSVCTGRGDCICSKCKCNSGSDKIIYSGQYCECDALNCPVFENSPCGSAKRGTCLCNSTCQCTESYEHRSNFNIQRCECPKETSSAARQECSPNPSNLSIELCTGHGRCECGKCVCETASDADIVSPSYDGRFCENCVICQQACSYIRLCAECLIKNESPDKCKACNPELCSQSDIENCQTNYQILQYDHLSESSSKQFQQMKKRTDFRTCPQIINECNYDVLIRADLSGQEPSYTLHTFRRFCPTYIAWWLYLIGAVAITIIVGSVVLIVWRVLVRYIESRQYKKFKIDASQTKFQMGKSPIYVDPDREVQNPAYRLEKSAL